MHRNQADYNEITKKLKSNINYVIIYIGKEITILIKEEHIMEDKTIQKILDDAKKAEKKYEVINCVDFQNITETILENLCFELCKEALQNEWNALPKQTTQKNKV